MVEDHKIKQSSLTQGACPSSNQFKKADETAKLAR
jgi:hypothetical protein